MSDAARSRKVAFTLAPLLLLLGAAALAQPAFQVKDFNTTRADNIGYGPFVYPGGSSATLGGTLFFTASDGIHGSELWRTDGTQGGTRLIADICPGSCGSGPQQLTVSGGQIFFLAQDGFHSGGLWKSDGTTAGTVLVRNLIPEGEYGSIDGLMDLGGRLIFSFMDYRQRHELWTSDGTEAGTLPLANFPQSDQFSSPSPLARLGGRIFFVGDDDDHGRELWTTDGTAAGTVLLKDIAPGPQGSAPGNPEAVAAGGRVLFYASGPEGFALWASDGTEAGTLLVKEIGGSYFEALTALGGNAFFFASSNGLGKHLWKSDGTAGGTGPVAPVPADVRRLFVAGGRLFFVDGCALWTSDGTAAGTTLVREIPGAGSSCSWPFPLGGGQRLLFFADDGIHGFEPWTSDGTPAGTALLADLYPGAPSSSSHIESPVGLSAGGRWYFRAKGGEDAGAQLWTTDGTAAGTRMLRINRQKSGFHPNGLGKLAGPRAFFDFDGTLLFQGEDVAAGAELWRSDGTAAGTTLVKDLQPGPYSSLPAEITRAGNTVFFRSDAGTSHEKLWKTDGTPAGTVLLRSVEQFYNFGNFSPRDLTALGDSLLFLGSCCNNSFPELIKSDGTPAGTQPVGTWPDSFYGSSIASLGDRILFQGGIDLDELWASDGTLAGTAYLDRVLTIGRVLAETSAARDGVLFFAGTAAGSGEELWRSDGTAAGTYLLAETVPGPGSKRLGPFATAGPAVFFAAGGSEIWKSDAGGTSLVRSLPGTASPGVRSLTALGNNVYFTYDDGAHGRELWTSDGTEAGTRLLADILPGPGSSYPQHLHVEGNVLLFSASDGVHGAEPWRSAGTALGTRMLQDIAPGDLPSSPAEFTASGPNVYFLANDGTTGFELWALPRTALLATFADIPADHWAWRFVEALAASGITAGCAADSTYCPAGPVTRAQAAVFLVRSSHGPAYLPPPATGTLFKDVPAGHWAGRWIEQLAADGVAAGCGGGSYCPDAPLTRAEIARLLLQTRHGSGFTPPPPTGKVFNDVPANDAAAPWIERLAAEGATLGCGGGAYCPSRILTRAEMAVLLVRLFALPFP